MTGIKIVIATQLHRRVRYGWYRCQIIIYFWCRIWFWNFSIAPKLPFVSNRSWLLWFLFSKFVIIHYPIFVGCLWLNVYQIICVYHKMHNCYSYLYHKFVSSLTWKLFGKISSISTWHFVRLLYLLFFSYFEL